MTALQTIAGKQTKALIVDKPDEERPIVIETRGLGKIYFGKVNIPVLHDIDLKIREQEFVAIIGQSGSGKSTLLNILGVLDVPTVGKVFVNGIDISTLDENGLANLRSEEIGFIFQAHYLLNEFTCLENALMPITIRHGEADRVQTARVLQNIAENMPKTPLVTFCIGRGKNCLLIFPA